METEYSGVPLDDLEVAYMKISSELRRRYANSRRRGNMPKVDLSGDITTTYLAVRIKEEVKHTGFSYSSQLRKAIHTYADLRGHHIADIPLRASYKFYPGTLINRKPCFTAVDTLFNALDSHTKRNK